MKKALRSHTTPPVISSYAQKQRLRSVTVDESALLLDRSAPRHLEIVFATIPDFKFGFKFMFPITETGEELFLSKKTIANSGYDLKPGDFIKCKVDQSPYDRRRRIVYIEAVNPRGHEKSR